MKNIITIALLFIGTTLFAQNKNAKTTIEVDGVCLMCKSRIEKACFGTKGVKSANWDVKTHELKLFYDERKVSLDSIKANIIAVGHDIHGELKATDEAYNSIHACCKYRDEAVKENHNEDETESKE